MKRVNMHKFYQFYVIVDKYGNIHDTYADRKEANHYYHLLNGKSESMAIKAAVSKTEDSQELAVYASTMKEALMLAKNEF
nr:MAG TPA: bacterial RNA polymerase inhibitor [Bacteriophage sp.]